MSFTCTFETFLKTNDATISKNNPSDERQRKKKSIFKYENRKCNVITVYLKHMYFCSKLQALWKINFLSILPYTNYPKSKIKVELFRKTYQLFRCYFQYKSVVWNVHFTTTLNVFAYYYISFRCSNPLTFWNIEVCSQVPGAV